MNRRSVTAWIGLGLGWMLQMASAAEIRIESTSPPAAPAASAAYPEQLPHSRPVQGRRDIAVAWLARPTDRYAHGVLGDSLEAASLVVQTRDGHRLRFDLPAERVFEDLEPRLVDLDRDGRDEFVVVESDVRLGAALAVYGLREAAGTNSLVPLAHGPFIGTAHRWLNPLGAGDFDGDGQIELAAVLTPHIGGILTLYRYTPGQLRPIADIGNVSTHRLGSTELGMGAVVAAGSTEANRGKSPDRLLVPDNTHHRLRLLALDRGQLVEQARVDLGSPLAGTLRTDGRWRWTARLADGRHIRITILP